jgi:hypothetical protein
MALVKCLAILEGIEGVWQKSYGTHFDDPDSSTEDMPQPQAPSAKVGEPSARGGARNHRRNAGTAVSGCVPPTGYFEPFFEGIHAQVQATIASVVGNFDPRFEHGQRFLQESLINPLQNSMNTMSTKMDLLATKGELQEVHSDVATNAQNIEQIRQSQDSLAAYLHQIFQPTTLGIPFLFAAQVMSLVRFTLQIPYYFLLTQISPSLQV